MKKNLLTLIAIPFFMNAFSQQMHVKIPDFNSFPTDVKNVSPVLEKKSSALAKQHPEYGILPYNAQCSNCVELIDQRTMNTRQFVETNNSRHTYSQSSYFPLHYKKSENDIWRTIDQRLHPVAGSSGVYVADNQPVPTKCDLNKKSSSIQVGDFEFEFNKNLKLYFYDESKVYTKAEPGNYTNYTIGQEGLFVKNMWNGINMQQEHSVGQIKTNFVINSPLQLPISTGWMVIEDQFSLPEGYTFEESKSGNHLPEGYQGDYILRNKQGDTLIIYEKPIYVDAKAFGMHGAYNLTKNGSDYTLQTLVPVEWLNKPDNTYPLFIDPNVFGITKLGQFVTTGLPSANLAFTSMALGSCDYHMYVVVPGSSTLTNAYVDLEYSLTYDNTCGSPPLPPPYCTFSQVTMQVVNDTCGTTTGLLTCNPAAPPYTGTCTTDSNLVAGAHAILINNYVPNYLACIPHQCSNYMINFTLKNQDSICLDVCGYLCARGNIWEMSVEGYEDTSVYISLSGDTLFSSWASGNQWYLNDTVIPGATQQEYIYSQPGIYTVTVIDSSICTDSSNAIDVTCYANFTIFQSSFDTSTYLGYNLCSGANLSFLWDFGDSTTSTQQYPQHIYANPGYYTVCLTVSRAGTSCNDTYCDTTMYFAKMQGAPMVHLNILSPTGIKDISNDISFSLYPNPATDELIIRALNFNPELLAIYNISGQKITEQKFNTHVDIAQLSSGMYLVELKSGNSIARKKFVKL